MATEDFYTALSTSLDNINKQRGEIEAAAAMARDAGATMAAAAAKPQFIPGTTETAGSLLQKKQAELQSQALTQKVAQATDVENLMVTLGQDMASLAHRQRAVTQKIMEDSSVSLWDDPLQAIANAFTLPWDEQELAGIQNKMNVTADNMNKLHSHVQQSGRTAEVISTKVTEASLAEVATAAEALQSVQAAKLRTDAARTGADAVTMALSLDSRRLEILQKERAARQQDRMYELAVAREARQQEILDKQLKEVQDKEEADALAFQLMNLGLEANGKNSIDMKSYKMWKGTSAEFVNTMIREGMRVSAAGGPKEYTQGATISDRMKIQAVTGWRFDTPQQETVMLMQDSAMKQAAELPLTDKKQIPQQAETLFRKNFRKEQDNIREGSAFIAPSYGIMNDKSRIGQHPIWQKYVTPTLTSEAAKANAVSPQFIANVVADAVAKGEITSSAAAEFAADVFKQAVAVNNEVHQFRKIAGIEQEKFGTKIEMGGITKIGVLRALPGGSINIDATDKTAWTAAIARKIAINMGLSLNTSGAYPEGSKDFYPPILKSNVVIGAQ